MSDIETGNPDCILLVSGKRKSGKDFVTDAIFEKIGDEKCCIIKISAPIKQYWSKEKGISFDELMSPASMKENHRKAMIEWSEAIRAKDPGYFCRSAISMYKANTKCIWIVSDVRRKTDVKWFRENYGDSVLTIRIESDVNVRKSRGWVFTAGIDDAETECDLDDYEPWDKTIINNGETKAHILVKVILDFLASKNKLVA